MADPAPRLVPPPEHQHFEFHWLKHRLSGNFIAINWKSSGWWNSDPIGSGAATPEQMYSWGWRYHGPCDPSAITLNPDDPAQVEAAVSGAMSEAGEDAEAFIREGWQRIIRAVIRRLKELKR